MIVEPYVEGKDIPSTYKFGNQEFKVSVRDVEEITLDWGGKLVFVNSNVGGAIDACSLPAILKGVMGRLERGPLTGSYARDVRVIVYDGKMTPWTAICPPCWQGATHSAKPSVRLGQKSWSSSLQRRGACPR